MRHWLRRVLSLLVLAPLVAGCALIRGTPVTEPGQGPGTNYPCGYHGVECHDEASARDPDQRCCPPQTVCTVRGWGPDCAADENYDPSDPTTWGERARIRRFAARR